MNELESYVSDLTLEEAQSNAHKCVKPIPLSRSEKRIDREMTAAEVSLELGIPESQVRSIEIGAIQKLKRSGNRKVLAMKEYLEC